MDALKEKERIEVYIRFDGGKTVCICPRNQKKCCFPCEESVVERDKFDGWINTMYRDRYGKSL